MSGGPIPRFFIPCEEPANKRSGAIFFQTQKLSQFKEVDFFIKAVCPETIGFIIFKQIESSAGLIREMD